MPPTIPAPTDLPHGLVFEHLAHVAELLAIARDGVQAGAEPEKGDGPWGVGCVTYERSCYAVLQLSARVDWAEVLDGTLQFVFTIDDVPMRFFHGPPDSTPARYRRSPAVERLSLQAALAFPDGEPLPALRVAVDTNDAGLTSSVWLLQTWEDETPMRRWEIWRREADDQGATGPAPIDLGPPTVSFGRPPAAAIEDGRDGAE
jgi:hypothetical protein